MTPHSPDICANVPRLPDERVEFVLDARAGLTDEPSPRGESLIVTNRRVVRAGAAQGSRVMTLLPLYNVSAVEVFAVGRSLERLGQGVLLLSIGLALGAGSWLVLGVQVLSVLLGGLPALAGVYALAGWAFPDTEGQFRIHSFGQVVAHPLRSAAARRDASEAAARLYALTWSEALAGVGKLIETTSASSFASPGDAPARGYAGPPQEPGAGASRSAAPDGGDPMWDWLRKSD